MGSPKALLRLRGSTFLERVIGALRQGGCSQVVVVVGADEQVGNAEIRRIAASLGTVIAENPDPTSEQITSVRIGLQALDEVGGVVVSPVDAPGVTESIVRALIAAGKAGAPVAVPTVGGRRGHPILFAGAAIRDLFGPLPEGARSVIRMHQQELVEVPADSEEVLLDVDTPEDFRRLTERGR